MIITKELLSEVWGEEVTKIESQCVMWDMDVLPFWSFEPEKYEGFGKSEKRFCIAIETIANKCKEWAFDNHYEISTWKTKKEKDTSYGTPSWQKDDVPNTYWVASLGVRYTIGDTEAEAIFKACQRILDNKDTK